MVAGKQVLGVANVRLSWNINIGVTLWNLHHKDTMTVAHRWKRRSQNRIRDLRKDDDQTPLQHMFWKMGINRPVVSVQEEFGYYNGTLVKHFTRASSKSWTD
jgi:hypothetical protein